jgi:hypothetical protein
MTALGGFLGFVPKKADTLDDQQTLARNIYQMYLRCDKQQLAAQTIIDRVLDADFFWATVVNNMNFEVKLPIDDYTYQIWTFFVRRLLEQIMLYGFALYRVVKLPADTPPDLMSDNTTAKKRTQKKPGRPSAKLKRPGPAPRRTHHPQVADGQLITIDWDDKFYTWRFTHASGGEMLAKDGWNLLMFAEPHVVQPGGSVIYSSMSANAYELSAKLAQTMKNTMDRDAINSKINVLTQFSKNFTTMPGSTKAFIQPAIQNSMMAVPKSVFDDVDEAIRNRAESALAISKATDRLREKTYKAYEQAASISNRDVRGKIEPIKPMRHDEHLITDAQEGKQLSYLRGPENIEQHLERIENSILFAFLIPPQALGKNINSERIAASNRLAESAIERYETMIKRLRRHVQAALSRSSREIASHYIEGPNELQIILRPCVSEYSLSMLEPVLDTKVAAELSACVHDIPMHYIDLKRLKDHQDMMLDPKGVMMDTPGAQKKPGGSGAAASKSEAQRDRSRQRDRPQQTNAQKSANSRAKNMA